MFNGVIPLNIIVSQRQPAMLFDTPSDMDNDSVEESLNSDEQLHIDFVFSYYQDIFIRHPFIIEWFKNRKILLSDESVKQFDMGFADSTLGNNFTRKDGRRSEYIRGSLQRLGLIKNTGFQFFRGCVVFIFKDDEGVIVGAYGRRLSNECRRHHVYHHHWDTGSSTFYNRDILLEHKTVILCKSPIEALTLLCANIPNVISLMGIYSFEHRHIRTLEYAGVKEVILALDNTDTGNQVAGLISQALEASNISCLRLKLPKNMDVNEYARKQDDHITALGDLVSEPFPCSQTYENLLRR